MDEKDLVIIPTYNEALNVSIIHKRIRENNQISEILFVDDNSPDNTSEVVNEIIKNDKKVFILKREKKMGIGSAHKDGFKWAKKKGYKYVTTIDSDLSHDPNLIREMIKNLKKYDIIITGRFLRDDTLEEWPLLRQIITKTRHAVVSFLLNIPYDTSGAFRCYNFEIIKIEDLLEAEDDGYSFFWESLYILYKKNYSILELPMKQPRRIHGSSKISFKDITRAITYLIYFFLKQKFKK